MQATFATLQDHNAEYAKALVEDRDLSKWHDRPDWRSKLAEVKGKPVRLYDVRRITIAEAVEQMYATAAASGAVSLSVREDKQVRFDSPMDAERYIGELLKAWRGICALTGLTMQLKDGDDAELRVSVDRKESNGHYEPGNLLLVCRFANRWRRASIDEEFLRLLALVRSVDPT